MKTLEYYLSFTQITPNGCMEWIRCINSDGYPRACIRGNANGKVHREVCRIHTGRDIDGLVVRHTCDNPKCINPEHLVLGSVLDNIQDRTSRSRSHSHVGDLELQTVLALRERGFTYKQIANSLGIKYKRVEYIIKQKLNLQV